MKRLRKVFIWVMLLTIFISNSPLIYAEEIGQAIENSQAQNHYKQSVEEAKEAVVGSESGNTEDTETSQTTQPDSEASGDAIQQPIVSEEGLSSEEANLRELYGAPIVESGQEQVYRVDDTHYVTYIGSTVKTFINEDGVELPLDVTLVSHHEDGQQLYKPKYSPVEVVLPNRVDEATTIDVIHGEHAISLYPIDNIYENATVQKNAILYNNVEGTTDVQYTVQSNGVKEEIILAKWEGKNRFSYGLDAGKYDVSLENNQVLVKEKGKEIILFVLTAPLMVDNAGETSQDLQMELAKKDGQYEVTVVANADWLTSEKRQYPVRVDPTVTIPRENILDSVTSTVHGQYQGFAYGYVGYMTVDLMGMSGIPFVKDIGRSRMYFKINYDFKKNIPSEARIDSASLNLYEYTAPGGQGTQFGAYRLTQDFDINTVTWNSSVGLGMEIAGERAISGKKIGMHNFDIRETVNGWVQDLHPNYGLVVAATDEGSDGGAFYTTEATAANAGQIGFTPDKAPSVTINWSVPDPVDINYPLTNTTINLRTMVKTDKKGKLQFQGVFGDGLTTPGAVVAYQLSDSLKDYNGQSGASFSYKYPDTSSFISVFEKGTTQYKDKLANWQTLVPFTEPELNTAYTIDAESQKDNLTSGKKSSDTFLIYKVTQYDTLPKIAAYYGVPLNQIAYDNRIQDMLVVKNNTLFIRNPSKNANRPYNPPALTDGTKADIDTLLMGRGLHCEFGFEPINLNTGNFYLDRTDISISDLNGDIDITRSYNSKAAGINSLFGRGWSFAFNEQLSSDEEENLYYTRTDGSILKFTKDGDKYLAPPGYDLALSVETVETKKADFGEGEEDYDVKEYHITDTENKEKIFDFHGLLASQSDEKGNKISFTYTDNAQLATITSPTGLVYNVTMNEAGYIGAIGIPNGAVLSYEYDENGNLVTYTDATGVATRYEYDENGLMTAWYDGNRTKIIENCYDDKNRVTQQTDGSGAVSTLTYSDGQTVTTDANGNKTTYSYDDQYRTTGISYPNGTTISKSYDNDNRLLSETNEAGQTSHYTYDDNGNVLSESRFDGAIKTFTYDDKNHLLTLTDFDGQETSYTYDKNGSLLTIILPNESEISHTVDKEGRVLSTTDALGNTITFSYTGANLTKVTNAIGGVSKLEYNAHNQLLSLTNPRAGVTSYTYDAEGRKTSETDPDGVITSYSFDHSGQVTAVTEGNGNTSTFSYDGFGRKLSASNGDGGTYTYTYDGVGNQISLTDARSQTTTYTYDSLGRLLTETDALGKVLTYTHDSLGRVLTRTNEAGQTSTLSYDDRNGYITKITDALGQVAENTYDLSGNLTKTTYPVGTSTNTTYDRMGHVLSYTDEAGQTSTYTYDAIGNKLTETIGNRTTTYTYDAAGNITQLTYPDKKSVTYTYDAMGNVISFTDAKGKETTYEYSPAGRLISTVDSLGQKTSMTYDANGNQNSVTDAAGYTASSSYNGQNQVSQVTDGLGNVTAFAYNQMDQVTEITDALNGKITYTYNELGYPIEVTDANANSTKISYTATAQIEELINPDGTSIVNEYDALDRLVKQSQSNGLVTEYSYDAANRLVSTKDNQGLNDSYTYDKAGNCISLTNSLGEVTSYNYDAYNQLIRTTDADGTHQSFTYDTVGNLLTSTTVDGHVTTYYYDKNDNLTKTIDHLARETSYSYDALNRVVKETDADANTTSYEYDVLGNLATMTDANGNSSHYGYDANRHLVCL